jgi:uncharacterized protein YaiI (UPF0178 family)
MKIIIDADACPKGVLQVCKRLGKEYGIEVWTVASFNHLIDSDHHVVVDSGSQAADLKVLNMTEKGDIVITQDWGLAAMVVSKPAKCFNMVGREYLADQIDFMMEEREVKAKLRRGGGRTKGPRKRTLEDDNAFEVGLRRALSVAKSNMEES